MKSGTKNPRKKGFKLILVLVDSGKIFSAFVFQDSSHIQVLNFKYFN